MSDWYEVAEGEEYRHRLTGRIVRVKHVAADEGCCGSVEWEAVDHREIERRVRTVQEAQHFLEDFDFDGPSAPHHCGPLNARPVVSSAL